MMTFLNLKIINIYIAKHFLYRFFTLTIGILLLIFVITFAEMLRKVDEHTHETFFDIIYLSLSQIPPIIDKIFPFLILLSSLWSVLGLVKTSELVIVKTAGISLWAISKIYFYTACIVSLIYVFVLMPFFAMMHHDYRQWENNRVDAAYHIHKKIILKDTGQVAFLTASRLVLSNNTLENVYVTLLNSQGLSETVYYSPQAIYEQTTQIIHLMEHDIFNADSQKLSVTHRDNFDIKVNLDSLSVPKQSLSAVYDYPNLIKANHEQKLSVNTLVVLFYSLLILPLTCGIYSFISMAFVPNLAREAHKVIGVVAMTLLLGVVFYILDNWIMTVSGNGKLPVLLGIITFKIVIFFMCVIMILNKEYGFNTQKMV